MYRGHERTNIRLKGYDYSSYGYYFITICVKNCEKFFGDVRNNIMGLSNIGCIAAKYWQEIPSHFQFIELDKWIVMPNHVHGILFIKNGYVVGARHGIDGYNGSRRAAINRNEANCRAAINRSPTNELIINKPVGGFAGKHNPMGKKTLGEIIRWFKGRCSFEIHKKYNKYFGWQSIFYDRIIRNDSELNRIREYIQCNPEKWWRDRNNIENLFM